MDVTIISPVGRAVIDQRAQGCQTNAAADKKEDLTFKFSYRKTVVVRAPDT